MMVILLYLLFCLICVLFSYLFVDNNLPALHFLYSGFSTNYKEIASFIYILLIVVFFLFFVKFIRNFEEKKYTLHHLKILIAVSSVLLFSYPAMLSYDIFNYILTAKVVTVYHENPYILFPIELVQEPFLVFTRAANKVALYGPVWIVLSTIPFILSFGNFILMIINIKIILFCFYLVSVLIIFILSKNINVVVFFALNPLILIETFISGHNDIVMVGLLLLAIYLLTRKKILLGLLFFVSSIGIKYATLVLVPLFYSIAKDLFSHRKINWNNFYAKAGILMTILFSFSFIREELYPWYAIWILAFSSFFINKFIKIFVLVSSFSLLIRYVPYMYTGTYSGYTPIIREAISITPIGTFIIYWLLKSKVWYRIKK